MNPLCLDALLLQDALYFVQSGRSIAIGLGAAIEDNYLHTFNQFIPSLTNLLFQLSEFLVADGVVVDAEVSDVGLGCEVVVAVVRSQMEDGGIRLVYAGGAMQVFRLPPYLSMFL